MFTIAYCITKKIPFHPFLFPRLRLQRRWQGIFTALYLIKGSSCGHEALKKNQRLHVGLQDDVIFTRYYCKQNLQNGFYYGFQEKRKQLQLLEYEMDIALYAISVMIKITRHCSTFLYNYKVIIIIIKIVIFYPSDYTNKHLENHNFFKF